MEKRAIYTIVGIVIAAVLVFSVYKLTGQATVGDTGNCLETDNGDDKWVQGITKYENREQQYIDYCYTRSSKGDLEWLHEYICMGRITSKRYFCANGCKDGACLKTAA